MRIAACVNANTDGDDDDGRARSRVRGGGPTACAGVRRTSLKAGWRRRQRDRPPSCAAFGFKISIVVVNGEVYFSEIGFLHLSVCV